MLKYALLLLTVTLDLQAQGAAGRSFSSPPYPTTGRIEITLHTSRGIGTLETLVRASPLIFEATALAAQNSVQLTPGLPDSVQTPIVVSIDRLLKGKASGTLTVHQQGGTLNGLEVVAPEAPLMKPGEKYILFLQQSWSPEPRTWGIAGGWAGLVKVSEDKVWLSPRSADALKQLQGISKDSFLKEVETLIQRFP